MVQGSHNCFVMRDSLMSIPELYNLKLALGDQVILLCNFLTTIDPTKHDLAKVCASVWAQAMEANSEKMNRYYPNDEERSDFAQDVKDDVLNTAHHLYAKMYVILCCGY
jgi:hypothetical protein